VRKGLVIILTVFISAFLFIMGCDVENSTAPDTTGPAILTTYPANWSTFYSEEVEVFWEVTDESELDSVAVFVNGEFYQNITAEPFTTTLFKTDFQNGLQTVFLKAVDAEGNKSISSLLNFYWLEEEEQSNINVSVLRPVLWEKVLGNNVQVSLGISSLQAVQQVEVYLDGAVAHTFISEPFDAELSVDLQGTHNIYAKVVDVLGYEQNSELVTFEVMLADLEDPTGFIAYPADWMDVSGTIDVRVTANDNDEISRVELYVDGILYNEIDQHPYHFSLDTTQLTIENHTLYAIIYDTSGNEHNTGLVNIRVTN